MREFLGVDLPVALTLGPVDGGLFNLPAFFISLVVTCLLLVGTKESAVINAFLVTLQIAALTVFCVLALPRLSTK